jgi:hypothetical protein
MTTKLIALGAINKHTGEYTMPRTATKGTAYSCPDCEKDLILCKGEFRVPHFRHFVETNPCTYYSKPSESQIHKDAKLLIKYLFDSHIPVSIIQTCFGCGGETEYEIEELCDTTQIVLEYRFQYKNIERVADAAIVCNKYTKPVAIFELYKTHKTDEEARPEPWFEIDARSLLTMEEKACYERANISCIRKIHCDDCREAEKAKLEIRYAKLCDISLPILLSNGVNFDFYVRYTLGQRDFKDGVVIYGDCICKGEFCNKRYKPLICHNRLDFDARHYPDESEENNAERTNNYKLLSLFKDKLSDYTVKLETHKGSCTVAICNSATPIDIYDIHKPMPSVSGIIDCTGYGTVEILKLVIRTAYDLNLKKLKRIQMLNSPKPPTFSSLYIPKYDIDDDADMYRSARKSVQDDKHTKAVKNMILLEENDIKYTEFNHVATIVNPVNNEKLRFSLATGKTLYKGKWINAIPLRLIIMWYNVDSRIL